MVTPPPGDEPAGGPLPPPAPADEEGTLTRINLRLPEQLKAGIEQAANRERLSVNAWLVRAAGAALAAGDGDRARRGGGPIGQAYTGWVR